MDHSRGADDQHDITPLGGGIGGVQCVGWERFAKPYYIGACQRTTMRTMWRNFGQGHGTILPMGPAAVCAAQAPDIAVELDYVAATR